MTALIILTLSALAFWFLTVDLGILSFGLACLVGWLIKRDRADRMMNNLMSMLGGLALLGVVLMVAGF